MIEKFQKYLHAHEHLKTPILRLYIVYFSVYNDKKVKLTLKKSILYENTGEIYE